MNHTDVARAAIENNKRKKHFNQKTFKKPLKKVGRVTVNTHKIDHDQMKAFASSWWNNWKDNHFIYDIVNGWLKAQTTKNKHLFLEYQFVKWSNLIPNFEKEIPKLFFIQQFNYCIPNFYIPWMEEEQLLKREYIKGELFGEVLNYLSTKKSVKIERIYSYFEEEYEDVFESVVKGAITRMVGLGYLEEIKNNGKVFYCLNKENVEKDSKGWFKR